MSDYVSLLFPLLVLGTGIVLRIGWEVGGALLDWISERRMQP